jgi:riboflavin kinase / FMN adenylyltransferase
MIVHFGLSGLSSEWMSAVVCLGTFDGVHLGHQTVIRSAVAAANDQDLPCCLVTFDRHPAATLRPAAKPTSLIELDEKLRMFRELGVSVTLVLPFDMELSQMPALAFLNEILRNRLRASELVIGHDFCFGHNREGTTDWVRTRIKTDIVPPFLLGDVRVSSSAIRTAIDKGELELANRMLGRPYTLSGLVVPGQRLGRTLGYPTINIARSDDQALPPDGVYAGDAETPYGAYRAAMSIGFRPAVQGKVRTVEAYLLDYPGDSLYGRHCRLRLHKKLRDELDFEDLQSLSEQIGRDVAQVRELGVIKH